MTDETKRSDEIGTADAPRQHGLPGPTPKSGAQLSAGATAFIAKAKDLGALRDSVVDAAGVSVGLWLSYLLVLFSLAIAVGGVTHRDLLLETPLKLPILYVDVPLVGFFVLGPALFLIVHAYVLLHFTLLAGKVGAFHSELEMQISDEHTRALLRRQLPSNVFVQFLAGPREARTGIMGFVLRLIAQISLVAAPLALLIYFQLQFLPYHDEKIVWWHRIAVVTDLALLWLFWPSLARGEMTWISWRELKGARVAAAAVASLTLVFFVFVCATFPGEILNRSPPIELAPTLADRLGKPFEIPRFWWSDRLFVSGIDVPENKRISLRGRRLEGAVLHNVVMKKVDFSAAQLQGAWFVDSDLRRTNFGCIDEMPGFTGLLMLAELFRRGEFETPRRKECADLRRTWFVGSELQGSSFRGANLRGSLFDNSDLQGALLHYAHIQGAYFADVKLDGAALIGARLEGATLFNVRLKGASLEGAFLHGALLKDAELQGASLKEAVLDGAQLNEPYVWRADPRSVKSRAGVSVTAVITGPENPKHECRDYGMCNWSATQFGSLKEQITQHTPAGEWRSEALGRIEMALDPARPLDGEKDMAKAWADLEHPQPALDAQQNEQQNILRENILRETGCSEKAAPYVIQGLMFQGGVTIRYNGIAVNQTEPFGGRFGADRAHPAALARSFLDEANCPGAGGLSEADKSSLREIRDGALQGSDGSAAAKENQE
jgi:uncharacterized protein YjbI with pentapeptide repeats